VIRSLFVGAVVFLLSCPATAHAEWQLKPSVGWAFRGSTTFVDSELAAGKVHAMIGINATLIGEFLGIEADVGRASRFFQQSSGSRKVTRSNVTTLTGNVTVALPRRLSEYTLRPYFVGGGGLMHVRADNFVATLSVADDVPAVDLGGGVTGFLTNRIGVNWDLRHFRTVGGKPDTGSIDVARGQLSFWRANMALAIRY